MLGEFGRRHHAPGVVHEKRQEPVLERRQRDRHAAKRDAHLARVERQRPGLSAPARLPGRAAQQRAQPRQQLLHFEGLRQVVVGAGVDALDALRPDAPGGQDENRKPAPVGPPALQHRQAVELGQAEIENRGVVGLGVAREPGLFAVPHESTAIPDALSAVAMSAAMRGSSSTTRTFISRLPPPRMMTPAPASTSTILRRPSARRPGSGRPICCRPDQIDRNNVAGGAWRGPSSRISGRALDFAVLVEIARPVVIVIVVVSARTASGIDRTSPAARAIASRFSTLMEESLAQATLQHADGRPQPGDSTYHHYGDIASDRGRATRDFEPCANLSLLIATLSPLAIFAGLALPVAAELPGAPAVSEPDR